MEPVALQRRTSGAWYLVGLGIIISAVTMGTVSWTSMRNGIEGMNRFDAPGKAKLTLPEGISILFVEGDAKTTCTVTDSEPFKRKTKVAPASGKLAYDSGGFAGRDAWHLEVEESGDYEVACESDKPVKVAVGRGIGAANVVVWIASVPAVVGVLAMLFVWWRRRRT
jgi:hypothetical protein